MSEKRAERGFDDASVFRGFWIGLLVGGVWALLNLPRALQQARNQAMERGQALQQQLLTDSVSESLKEGKALARQHQTGQSATQP